MEENNNVDALAKILMYNQIREKEEFEQKEAELKALASIFAPVKGL
jgi:hypothetical protein